MTWIRMLLECWTSTALVKKDGDEKKGKISAELSMSDSAVATFTQSLHYVLGSALFPNPDPRQLNIPRG